MKLVPGMHVLIEPTLDYDRFEYCCVPCMDKEDIKMEHGDFRKIVTSWEQKKNPDNPHGF